MVCVAVSQGHQAQACLVKPAAGSQTYLGVTVLKDASITPKAFSDENTPVKREVRIVIGVQ